MNHTAAALILEGIDLIEASRLARWSGRFVAEAHDDFEDYWPRMHPKYGRWFCWLALGVGAERILRGAYKEKGLNGPSFGSDHNWQALGVPASAQGRMAASFKKLAKRRNEGAHSYIPGIRDGYFTEVHNDYAPALNLLLDAVGYPTATQPLAPVTATTDVDHVKVYCRAMAEIRDRINVVQTIMGSGIRIGLPGQPHLPDQTAELIFVQFRKVLEGMAFAALAANKEKYAEVHANFAKHWRAKDMLRELDAINPDFFPVPMAEPVEIAPGHQYFGPRPTDDVFTREDFVFLYQCSSEALHTRNPYKEVDPPINAKYTIQEWVRRLQRLLAWHRTTLLNGDVWVIQIPKEGSVHAYPATPTTPDSMTEP